MPKADTMVNKTPSMIKRNIVVYFLSLINDFDEYDVYSRINKVLFEHIDFKSNHI